MSDEEKQVLIQVLQDLVVSTRTLALRFGNSEMYDTMTYDLTLLLETFGVV